MSDTADENLLCVLAVEFADDYGHGFLLDDIDTDNSATVALAAIGDNCYTADTNVYRTGTTVEGYYERTVPLYSPSEFMSHFRLSRHAVEGICARISDGEHGTRYAVPLEKQVLLTLWTLANQESFRTISDRFGIQSRGLAHYCFVNTCQRIKSKMFEEVISWPSSAECRIIADEYQSRHGFPGVMGCIDGSHIPVKAPSLDRDSYVNRKGFTSINLLAVCDYQMRFLYVFADCPGSTHDAQVLRMSSLGNSLLSGSLMDENYHLLGDAAYPLHIGLLVPFRDNGHLTEGQTRYNVVQSAARCVIERAFGRLKGKFRRLKYLDVTRTDLATLIIETACVLHNVSLSDGCEEEVTVQEAECDIGMSNQNCPQQSSNSKAREKRDNIMHSL